MFYDRRNTIGVNTDVYIAKSTYGGEAFENIKVSESSFTPTSSVFFGDYTNVAAWKGKIYPIWMRLHNSELSVWTSPVTDSSTVTATPVKEFVPDEFVLYQNYPNPFNQVTTISYQLPEATHTSLKVYDALGNEIETLVNKFMPAGVHEVTFNASNLSSGIYLYTLKAGTYEIMKKMIVIK